MIPSFLLRKLYRKGSLREVGPGRFAFTLQNPLTTATIIAPPEVTVNGIHYAAEKIQSGSANLAAASAESPFIFEKGAEVNMAFDGHLMRGGNRIAIDVMTKEFGELEIFLEEREATFCDMPDGDAAEE